MAHNGETKMNQIKRISNRELRKIRDRQNRSDALNRYIAQCEQDVADAKMDTKVVAGIGVFNILILISALLGLK